MSTLETFANATRPQLEDLTVKELRELAKHGSIKGYTRLKKAGLIDAMLLEGIKLRKLAQSINAKGIESLVENEMMLSEEEGNFIKTFAARFNKAFKENYNLTTGEFKDTYRGAMSGLGVALVRYLDTYRGVKSPNGLKSSGKLKARARILNGLKENIDDLKGSLSYNAMVSGIEVIEAVAKQALLEDAVNRNTEYKKNIGTRKLDKTEIKVQPLIDWATEVLKGVNDDLKKKHYKEVSIALALVTGRRQAEIHVSETSFSKVRNKRAVSFTGQLKTRGEATEYFDKNPSYDIPTLVDSQLVINAHEWLKANDKTADSPKKVHVKFCRYLNEAMTVFNEKFGLNHDKVSYKSLRSIYALTAYKRQSDNQDIAMYLGKILGHGRSSSDIPDLLTPQSYNADFVIID